MLYQIINNKKNKKKTLSKAETRINASFYKYFEIQNVNNFYNNFYKIMLSLNVLGRVYIANEGINAQVSIPSNNFEFMKSELYSLHPDLKNIHINIALNNLLSFLKLRVKIKKNIVSDGIKDKNFFKKVGIYLKAKEVNSMINDPDTVLVDIRNKYEYEVGHFDNAIGLPTNTFRDQLAISVSLLKPVSNKKIIMYCTGGIRCEKASAWLLYNGFKRIYQIDGGIINYVNQAREQNLPIYFRGKNFVFDFRMGERVTNDIISNCHQCGKICDIQLNCMNDSCHRLFIQCRECSAKYSFCCSKDCIDKIS